MILTEEKNKVSPSTFLGLEERDQRLVLFGRTKHDIHEIIQAGCSVLGVTMEQLVSPKRTREIAEARTIIVGIFLQITPDYGLKRLGRLFNRDHSTVLYQRDLFKDLYGRDKPYTAKVEAVLKLV